MPPLLCLKIFLRKRDTTSSILTIALLVAILTSIISIVNFLNIQVESLARLREPAGRYIIVNEYSISESRLDPQLPDKLHTIHHINEIRVERIFWSNITIDSKHTESLVRGVSDIERFLKARRAHLNGAAPKNTNEAVIGELAANTHTVSRGTQIYLQYNNKSTNVTITGIFRTQTEIDTEILLPIEGALNITGEEHISLIEFTLKKGTNVKEALTQISNALPEGTRIIQVQQPILFTQQINIQTSNFLAFWSLAVYAVVASASYIITAHLTNESIYEIQMLRTLGAKRLILFTLILLHTLIIATLASILGAAIGLTGAQVISAALSWLTPSIRITPLLELPQLLQILCTTIFSAIIGCLYPAYKAAKVKYTEKLL